MTDQKAWQRVFDELIEQGEVIVMLRDADVPLDGLVTRLVEGVYQVEGKISVKETGEAVALKYLFPFEAVVWAAASPMAAPQQQPPKGALSDEELAELLKPGA